MNKRWRSIAAILAPTFLLTGAYWLRERLYDPDTESGRLRILRSADFENPDTRTKAALWTMMRESQNGSGPSGFYESIEIAANDSWPAFINYWAAGNTDPSFAVNVCERRLWRHPSEAAKIADALAKLKNPDKLFLSRKASEIKMTDKWSGKSWLGKDFSEETFKRIEKELDRLLGSSRG